MFLKHWENTDKCLQIFKNSEKCIDCCKKILRKFGKFQNRTWTLRKIQRYFGKISKIREILW